MQKEDNCCAADWDAELQPIAFGEEDWDADLEPIQAKCNWTPPRRPLQKLSTVNRMPLQFTNLMRQRRSLKNGVWPKFFQCPYNKSHSIEWDRAWKHLNKCRELPGHRNAGLAACPLVDGHSVPEPELTFHLLTCPGDLYNEERVKISRCSGVGTGGKVSSPNYHLPYNFRNSEPSWD